MTTEWRRRSSHSQAAHIPTQLEVLRGVLLLAAQSESWMTLEELARKTKFPEASISAQLRHLRKEEYGAYLVEKRRRGWQEALRTNAMDRVWEYRLRI
jgi:transcriptional antiterminator